MDDSAWGINDSETCQAPRSHVRTTQISCPERHHGMLDRLLPDNRYVCPTCLEEIPFVDLKLRVTRGDGSFSVPSRRPPLTLRRTQPGHAVTAPLAEAVYCGEDNSRPDEGTGGARKAVWPVPHDRSMACVNTIGSSQSRGGKTMSRTIPHELQLLLWLKNSAMTSISPLMS